MSRLRTFTYCRASYYDCKLFKSHSRKVYGMTFTLREALNVFQAFASLYGWTLVCLELRTSDNETYTYFLNLHENG